MNLSKYLGGQTSYNEENKALFKKEGRSYLNKLSKELVKLSPKLKFQTHYNAGGIACSGEHNLEFSGGEFFFNADCCNSTDNFFAVFRSKDGNKTGNNHIVKYALFSNPEKLAREIVARLSL